jgi:cytohesin
MTLATRLTDTFTVEVSSQDQPIREQSNREELVQEEPTPTAELQSPRGIPVAESQGKRSPVTTAAKPSGNATLHSAISEGAMDVVKWFIERGADLEALDDKAQSPLYIATWRGDKAIVQLLIEYGASVNGQSGPDRRSIVHSAVLGGHMDIVQLLLEAGADLTTKDRDDAGPIHAASARGTVAMMNLLGDHGADWKDQAEGGDTAMHSAATYSNLDAITWLVDQGLSVNEPRNEGIRPIHLAACVASSETVRLLAEKGARIDARNKWGCTAIMFAACAGRLDNVELLADLGADTTKTDNNGYLALHFAIEYGHVDVVKFLIARGSDLLRHAESVCELARTEGYADVVRFLQYEHAAAVISEMLADGDVLPAASPYVPFPHKLQSRLPLAPKLGSSFHVGDEVEKKLFIIQLRDDFHLSGTSLALRAGPSDGDPILAEVSRVARTTVVDETNYILSTAPRLGGRGSYGEGLSILVRDLTANLKDIYYRFTLQGEITQGQSLPEPETFEWRQVTKERMQDAESEGFPQIFHLRKIVSPDTADTVLREAHSNNNDDKLVAVVVYNKNHSTRSVTWALRFIVQVEARTAAAVIVTSFHIYFEKSTVEDLVKALGYDNQPQDDEETRD